MTEPRADQPTPPDRDPDPDGRAAIEAALSVGIDLPAACVAGVAANRRLLASHAARVDRFLAGHPDA